VDGAVDIRKLLEIRIRAAPGRHGAGAWQPSRDYRPACHLPTSEVRKKPSKKLLKLMIPSPVDAIISQK
jgi:hypothetical protein